MEGEGSVLILTKEEIPVHGNLKYCHVMSQKVFIVHVFRGQSY